MKWQQLPSDLLPIIGTTVPPERQQRKVEPIKSARPKSNSRRIAALRAEGLCLDHQKPRIGKYGCELAERFVERYIKKKPSDCQCEIGTYCPHTETR